MPEPSSADLIDSVVAAGQEMKLGITSDAGGTWWIAERGGVAVDPPIEVQFTADSLARYYRGIVEDPGRGEISPWDWWCTLMSTHFYEALYQLGRIDGPAAVVIERTGFVARPI